MKIILIIVLVVLLVYAFWPKSKKPATSIDKARGLEGVEDIEIERDIPEDSRKTPDKYLQPYEKVGNTSGFFYGKKICVSGEFNSYAVASDLVEELWRAGATIHSCTDESCDILICGDEVSPSKLQKAQNFGMQIMHEEELLEKLNKTKRE